MKKHRWTIYRSGKFVDSGVIEASDEREALSVVLREQGTGKNSEHCYTITVGSLMTSAFGDEFQHTAASVTSAIANSSVPSLTHISDVGFGQPLTDKPRAPINTPAPDTITVGTNASVVVYAMKSGTRLDVIQVLSTDGQVFTVRLGCDVNLGARLRQGRYGLWYNF